MKAILLYALPLFFSITVLAQQTSGWQASLKPQKAFIKNEGQFKLPYQANTTAAGKVLFVAEIEGGQIMFTERGVVYHLQKREKLEFEEEKYKLDEMSHQERERLEHSYRVITKTVEMQWANVNPAVVVKGQSAVAHYYNYSNGDVAIDGVKAFEKLVYTNLYPNIDVEYVFHPQSGIEYNFIVHPGGNANDIQMDYSGTKCMKIDSRGDIHIPTPFGDIVDHVPVSFYSNNKGATVASGFVRRGNSVSFQVGNYDRTKELTIDPWTVTPSMPNSNRIFCVKTDSSSNVYIYGGDSPFKLQKYNSSGVLQWTYASPWDSSSWFGTLQVDKVGNSYITLGSVADIIKVNKNGTMVWNGPNVPTYGDEYWSLAFNADETQLVAGGTRLKDYPLGNWYIGGMVYEIDINNGNQSDTIKVTERIIPSSGAPFYPNEVRSICFAPNGSYYFLTLDTIGSIDTSLAVNYLASSGTRFSYRGADFAFTPQGQNLICANTKYIYTSRADTIEMRDIANGNILLRKPIPGGGSAFLFDELTIKNAGIAIDNCGYVYAGSQTGVCKFDANLNQVAFAATPAAVYALAVNNNGEVVASGEGFVVSLNLNACSPYLSPGLSVAVTSNNATCAGVCNGSAQANPSFGTPPYTYVWSNGSTTSAVSGLCVGSYTVTTTDNAGTSATASCNIGVNAFTVVDSVINTTCGGATGVVGIMSTTGVPPYVFQWSTGSTASVIFALSSGVYFVTITDSVGCMLTDSFTVFGTGSQQINITANAANICANDTANVCAPAGYALYNWSNGQTTSCINVSQAGAYNVTVTDNSYCTATSQALTITVLPLPTVSVALNGNILNAQSPDQITSYQWYRNGVFIQGANSASYTATLQGNYAVEVTAVNGCNSTSSAIYYSPCSAYFVLFPDLNTPHNWYAINQATGAQPLTYLWNWGDGSTSAGAYPTHVYNTAGYYDVCLSITDSNGCAATYCDSAVYLYKTDEMITVNVVSEIPNGILEAQDLKGVLLYPNPAGDVLNVSFKGEQIDKVRIFGTDGKLLLETNYPDGNRVDVKNFPSGVYVAEVYVLGAKSTLRWKKH